MVQEIFIIIQGLSVLFFFGNVIGNSLVLAVLSKVKSMKTATNVLLGSLARNDLIFAINAFLEVCMGTLKGPTFMVAGFSVKFVFHTGVSMFTLAAIAVERYYAILKPFVHRARITKKLMKKIAWGIWIVTGIIIASARGVQSLIAQGDRETYLTQCALLNICIVVPGIVMIACYSKVIYRVWFKTQELDSTNACVLKSRKKLTKLLVTVSVVFFVCWTPLLGRVFEYKFQSTQGKAFYHRFSGCLALAGSAINPMLYSLRSPKFRQAVRKLFSGLRCCQERAAREIQQQPQKERGQTTSL